MNLINRMVYITLAALFLASGSMDANNRKNEKPAQRNERRKRAKQKAGSTPMNAADEITPASGHEPDSQGKNEELKGSDSDEQGKENAFVNDVSVEKTYANRTTALLATVAAVMVAGTAGVLNRHRLATAYSVLKAKTKRAIRRVS